MLSDKIANALNDLNVGKRLLHCVKSMRYMIHCSGVEKYFLRYQQKYTMSKLDATLAFC